MSHTLPPLTALRAFESAARHRSLKKAAEELNVTPAAVSHQIQILEDMLGVRLFRRVHRGIELTASAEIFFPKLEEGFDCLRQAVGRLRDHRGADVLEVGAPPSFISNWLMPRLHRFVTACPDIDVRVSTRVRQFSRLPRGPRGDVASVMGWVDEVDVLVVFGNGGYPGMRVDQLMPLTITPLCSPALLEGDNPLREPDDLRRHVLLHDDRGVLYEGPSFWDMWLEKAGVTGIDTSRGPHFWHSIPAMEAAVACKGVVATTKELARLDLATGRLVAPFPLEVRLASSYHIVSNEPASKREVVRLFRDWLGKEARTA
ncbi:LysR family transcriptional regulator [Pigmentiphaga daeguensis]|uniref:LysR family transcriptional regulator n=1 Tax=Pigmentiphaga daeguensis TaxID=414049 RepID=A0ABP3MF56_9BURK